MIYPTLLDRYEDRGDVFDVAQYVWGDGEKPSGVRYGSQAGLSATDLYQLYMSLWRETTCAAFLKCVRS